MKMLNNNQETNTAVKIASACLILFLLAGLLSSVAHGIEKIGFSPRTVATYYLGSEEEMIYPKELSELKESTHVHIFMIPLIFYILCHLFAQTSLPTPWKVATILLTFANIAGFLAAPYLIRYLSPRLAVMLPLHEVIFLVCAGILTVVPLREVFKE